MISETIHAQIKKIVGMVPMKEGEKRKMHTTEGEVVVTMTGGEPHVVRVSALLPMPWQFSRVVVINRPDRPEKKLALLTHLREIGWPFVAPEWHVATPGNQLPPPPPDWKSTRNIWAGNKSHCQVISESYERGDESVLIMEDDCLYLPDFLARVRRFLSAAPVDWGMLYLGGRFANYAARPRECGHDIKREHWGGGEIHPPRREHVRDSVYRVCGLNNMESYAVHRRFMPEAIRVLEETRFHGDVALNLVQWSAKTYHMLPPLAQQRAGWSDNFGVNKSDRDARLSTRTNEGAVILSTGSKRKVLAANSAASFRRNNPALGLHLFSDSDWIGYNTTKCDGSGFASRAIKTKLLADSPFSSGVILDDDTITLRPLPPIRDILGDYDLAMAPDRFTTMGRLLHSNDAAVLKWLSREEADYTLSNFPDCASDAHWNSGVIFFRQTDAVKELSRVWHEEWTRFRKVDQIALFRAIRRTGIKVRQLPPFLHYYSDNRPLPHGTVIAHVIGRKWQMSDWLSENGLPFVAPPPSVGCCGAAKNAAKAAARLGGAVVGGGPVLVSKDVRDARLSACNSCEHLNRLIGVRQCSLCSCFVSLKSKLATEDCPAGKWATSTDTQSPQ